MKHVDTARNPVGRKNEDIILVHVFRILEGVAEALRGIEEIHHLLVRRQLTVSPRRSAMATISFQNAATCRNTQTYFNTDDKIRSNDETNDKLTHVQQNQSRSR